MSLLSLGKLGQKIRNGDQIEDSDLLETLGRDGTISVPMEGGGEQLLPSGEILSVLADGADLTVEQVLTRNFRMSPAEISMANEFIRLVQFASDDPVLPTEDGPQQPFQSLDR